MNDNDVCLESRGALGLITLNRPKALNALTRDMCVAMRERLETWKADTQIACVAIRGVGERSFCAGGDIRSLYESGKAGTSYALDFYREEYLLNAAIKHFPKPYIALLRGIVMGGGVGVSVHGLHRVADESVVFAMPETGIGLFPDVGGSYFLPRCRGELGMYLALTGARLKTADCLYAGIATHHVKAADFESILEKLETGVEPLAALAPFSQASAHSEFSEQQPNIDRLFSHHSVEAVLAALDHDDSDWARAAAKTIRTKSPTATKLAFRQIREGAKLGFDDCMRMEFRMVNRVVSGHDFYEGVRAAIIDKDQAPKWKPAVLGDVVDRDIDAYFAPLGQKELPL